MFGFLGRAHGRLGSQSGGGTPTFAGHELALDFVNGGYRSGLTFTPNVASLPGYSFARTGDSYEVAADGTPLFIPSGSPPIVPGVGYWARQSLTNISLYSNTTSHVGWIGQGWSKVSGQADWNGGNDAALVTWNGNNEAHFSSTPSINYTTGLAYTFVRYVKHISGDANMLQMTGSSGPFGTNQYANFDLTGNGSVTATLNGAANIYKLSNGWFRLEYTTTATSTVGGGGTIVFGIPSPTSTRAVVAELSGSFLTSGSQVFQTNLTNLPLIVTEAATATVTPADMRLTQPIPVDEDWLIWVTVNHKQSNVSVRPLSVRSSGLNRIDLERSATGATQYIAQYSGDTPTFSAVGSPAFVGANRATHAARRLSGLFSPAGYVSGNGFIGGNTARTYPLPMTYWVIGSAEGAFPTNSPIEFVGYRRGAFDDAALLAILGSA